MIAFFEGGPSKNVQGSKLKKRALLKLRLRSDNENHCMHNFQVNIIK